MRPNPVRCLIARALFLPTLGWNVLLGRILRLRHWSDPIEEHVILGALPFSSDVPRLASQQVKAVVNTCEEYCGPLALYGQYGIEQFHMPTCDFCHPKLADVQRAVDFMRRHVRQRHTVYVHCKAGRARSATVVMCWLIAERGLSPEAAQRLLLEKRPHVNARLASRPVVKEFYRLVTAPPAA